MFTFAIRFEMFVPRVRPYPVRQFPGELIQTMGSLWGHFGVTLGSLWGHFGVTLGPLWGHLAATLGIW